ncbi:hypothetical protein LMG19282_01443 [Cupriavidus campinensis]|uniref:Competence protein CoiA n=1 Tax=Cupriavidus campinensis TaxID=151783 RepID=A0ABY3EJ99_9BURK|nr:competence protein CoiA family protein [Cupriavidus campinensis]TSP11027.1 hypothetical protein FGG12_19390 [Cupriavidus campinensis]CAG2138086.1 hypothetical protein LMG19282_01443 [Cupriavidus campinensis]
MLVALRSGVRSFAHLSHKGPAYHCPGCGQAVTLKKGLKKAHHFAHKPPVTCSWAKGETAAHLAAKMLFLNHFLSIPRNADVEFPIGTQRADVYAESKDGDKYIFEMQHQPITEQEIARRTAEYHKHGAAVTWLPLIDLAKFGDKKKTADGYVIERYSPKPFEKWLQGYHWKKDMWYVDTGTGSLWHGVMDEVMLSRDSAEWYEPGGYMQSVSGYSYPSKRWRKLTLTGPYTLSQVRIARTLRKATSNKAHTYPGGYRIVIVRPDVHVPPPKP